MRSMSAAKVIRGRLKGAETMDDLEFNSSALLIIGMLIGVVCALL